MKTKEKRVESRESKVESQGVAAPLQLTALPTLENAKVWHIKAVKKGGRK